MSRIRLLLAGVTCLAGLAVPPTVSAGGPPPWNEIHAGHFVVLTDGSDKRGREVALRFEQMRAAFGSLLMKNRLLMPVPLTIIAVKNEADYWRVAPASKGRAAIAPGGFLLSADDRTFVVLNLAADAPWQAVAYDSARLLLNYNYPPTQSWFDEGLAEYFSSLRLTDKQVELGSDPGAADGKSPGLAAILSAPDWMGIEALFATQMPEGSCAASHRATKFCAQSWIVMHYLLHEQLLPQAGAYFDLVHNQKLPVEQAVAKAFGMPADQLQQKVVEYFRSLNGATPPATPNQAAGAKGPTFASAAPAAVGPDDVAMNLTQTPDADGRARLAEVMARDSSHREQAIAELQSLASGAPENEVAHRALAWAHIENKEFEPAVEDLNRAAELDPHDRWVRYYLALLKYRMAQEGKHEIQGLANMIQDLKAVLDWYPEFAEAYNLLAMARVEGGGQASSLEAMRAAVQLSPRNQQYVYNLGTIYVAGKKWEAARALFERLSVGSDPKIAEAARNQLGDLDSLQKYGVPPQKPAAPKAEVKSNSQPAAAGASTADATEEPPPLTGPILFLKGRLVSVDCSQPPVATLSVTSGGRTLSFHTRDYKALLVIGADAFACEWKNRPIAVNYRATGKGVGELVSVELQ